MAYLNYRNLDPTEFETLAKDVMERLLGCRLFRYGAGKDGGIDFCDDISKKHIVVQCKNYLSGSFNSLYSALKNEESVKINAMTPRPERYYVFTSLDLLPGQKKKILDLFREYMTDESCIVDGIAINDFFRDERNHDLVSRNIKLFLSFPDNYQYSPADHSQLEKNKLYDQLLGIFENDRKNHLSIRMMDPDPSLFPKGLPEIMSDGRLAVEGHESPRAIRDMVRDSWKREDQRHILLVGEGGIGKTVAMLTLPEEDWFKNLRIPVIYVPLQRLDVFKGDLNRYIREKIGDNHYSECVELANSIPEGHPGLLLLLDGFNEIPDSYKREAGQYIREWMVRPGVQIILTSRQKHFLGDSFLIFRLQPLSQETIRSFLQFSGFAKVRPEQKEGLLEVINSPLMLAIYTQIEKVKEVTDRSSASSLLEWRAPDNAAHIIWNYLQMELYRCIENDPSSLPPILYAEAIFAVAPYICCQMSRQDKYSIERTELDALIQDALVFYSAHVELFDGQSNNPFDITFKEYYSSRYAEVLVLGGKTSEYARILVKGIRLFQTLEMANGNEVFVPMHKIFRDVLAAYFICTCLIKIHGTKEKKELLSQADYVVKNYVEELLSDQELIEIWNRHREEEPEDGQITASLLELIGRQRNYDYRDLDFSGLDLTNANIHSHLSKRLDICPLPSDSRRFERTKISLDCLTSDGHAGRVRSIALSLDGMYLAGGTDDGKVRIWNLESGESRVLEGHTDVVRSVAFSPDGRQLASGSSDRAVRIWNLENMTCMEILEGHAGGVSSAAFSPDGRQLASGSSDGTVRIWDLENMTCGGVLEGHVGGVNSVAFSPDGRYLASGSSDRAIRIWYPQVLTCERVLEGHAGGVNSVAFSHDSRYLASGSSDRTVRIWNPASGESRVLEGHTGSVNTVAFSSDGRQLASGSSDRTVRKWDPETEESKVLSRFAGEAYGVAFNPDDSQLAIGINDGTVRILDLESYREIWKYAPVPPSLNLRGANFQLAIIDGKDLEILKAAGVLLSEKQLTTDADHGGMDSANAYQIRNQIRRFFEQDPQKYCHVESFIDFIRENDTDDMRSFLADELYYLLRISESDNVIFPLHQDPVLQQLIYQIWMIDTQRLRMQEIVTRPDADDVPMQAPQSSQESNDIKRPLEDQQKSSVLCDDVAVEEATEIVLRSFQDWLEKELNEKGQKYRIIQSARRQSSGDQHGYDVGLELQIGDATYKVSFECKDYTSNIKENGRNRNTKIRSYAGNLLQYFINSDQSVNNRWVLVNVYGDLQNDYPSKLFETWNKSYDFMKIFAITEKSSAPTCKQFFSVDENAYQLVYPGSAPIPDIDGNRETVFSFIYKTVIGGDCSSVAIKKKLKKYGVPGNYLCKPSSELLSVRTKDGDAALIEVLGCLDKIQRNEKSNSDKNGIYIIGEYGTGKTWLLYRIIVEIINQPAKYPFIPVLMKLKEFFMELNELSDSYLGKDEIHEIAERYVDKVMEQHDQLEEHLMLYSSPVFLLDGFDEVLSGLSATNNKIRILLSIRDELNSRYRELHPVFIVTSRESDYHACQTNKEFIDLFRRFYKITLEECTVSEVKGKLMTYAENADISQESIAGITENQNMLELACRPVFYALLQDLLESKDSSLEGVVDEFSLLNSAVDSEIRRTITDVRPDKDKTTGEIRSLRQALLEALMNCAIYCTQNNGNEAPIVFSRDELNDIVPSGIVVVKNKDVEAATPDKPWTFRLNQNNERRVSFLHNIVREFLVAKKFFLLIEKCVSGEAEERDFFDLMRSVQMSPVSLRFFLIFIQNAPQEQMIKEKIMQWLSRPAIKQETSNLPARLLELLLQPDCTFGGREEGKLDLSGIHADNLCIWNCELRHLDLSDACLRNMQMTDVRLSDVDLRGVDLSGLRLAPSRPIIDICYWRQDRKWHIAVLYQNGQVLKYSFTDRFMEAPYSVTLLQQFEGATGMFNINGALYVVIAGKTIYPLEEESGPAEALYDMSSEKLIHRIVSAKEANSILVQNGTAYLSQVIHDETLISKSIDITESDRYFLTNNGLLVIAGGDAMNLISETGEAKFLYKWEEYYECFTIYQGINGENHIYIKTNDHLIQIICDDQFNPKSAPKDFRMEGTYVTMQDIRAIREGILAGISESDLYIIGIKTNEAVVEKVNTAVKASGVVLNNDDGSRRVQDQEAFELLKGSMVPFDETNAHKE